MADEPVPPPPRGLMAAFDELLKRPSAGVERPPSATSARPALLLLAGSVACWGAYGAAAGFFQGGWHVPLAIVKVPIIIGLAVLLCFPSLYILSALTGADVGGRRLLVLVAGFAGTLGIFMAGLLPIAWLFSVSSESLAFVLWTHLALWAITVGLAGRYLGSAVRARGGRLSMVPWLLLFVVVSFQTTTLLRPTLLRPPGAPMLPGFSEKLSFLQHFASSVAPPALADIAVDTSAALAAVVETDRAFARASSERDHRTAGLEFLAEDALGFDPALGSAKMQWRSRPATGETRQWEPRTGDVSRAGDLAWLAGPCVSSSAAGGSPGAYLSIWKRQGDGSWRAYVALDTRTPEPVAFPGGFQRLTEAGGRYQRRTAFDTGEEEMLARDRSLEDPSPEVLAYALHEGARLHFSGEAPIVGLPAIRDWLKSRPLPLVYTPIDGDVAASGDLGFAFGRYLRREAAPGPGPQPGYYVRVYRRWPSGHWTVVAQVLQERP